MLKRLFSCCLLLVRLHGACPCPQPTLHSLLLGPSIITSVKACARALMPHHAVISMGWFSPERCTIQDDDFDPDKSSQDSGAQANGHGSAQPEVTSMLLLHGFIKLRDRAWQRVHTCLQKTCICCHC